MINGCLLLLPRYLMNLVSDKVSEANGGGPFGTEGTNSDKS